MFAATPIPQRLNLQGFNKIYSICLTIFFTKRYGISGSLMVIVQCVKHCGVSSTLVNEVSLIRISWYLKLFISSSSCVTGGWHGSHWCECVIKARTGRTARVARAAAREWVISLLHRVEKVLEVNNGNTINGHRPALHFHGNYSKQHTSWGGWWWWWRRLSCRQDTH